MNVDWKLYEHKRLNPKAYVEIRKIQNSAAIFGFPRPCSI
jgi:hypothetical protein